MSFLEAGALYLLAVNVITLIVFRYDKKIAGGNRRRIPEGSLLLWALLGGSAGAVVSMYLIKPRHKTRKLSFLWRFWGIIVLQVAGLFFIYWQSGQRT